MLTRLKIGEGNLLRFVNLALLVMVVDALCLEFKFCHIFK